MKNVWLMKIKTVVTDVRNKNWREEVKASSPKEKEMIIRNIERLLKKQKQKNKKCSQD